jgi:hypothetical protein
MSAKIYIEISESGVERTHVDATDASETAEAHDLLKRLAFEIRSLDAALKTLATKSDTD